jgi:hypothetical protein
MTTNRYTAKDKRRDAVLRILGSWIGQEDDGDIGKLIRQGSFADMLAEVDELRTMSRTEKWQAGCDKWRETILQMYNIFCRDNEFDALNTIYWNATDAEFAEMTRREFISLLKHTVNVGTTHVWGI